MKKTLALLLLLSLCFSATAQQQPNIVFLLTDDQRADAMSCAGHPVIQTPNLDRLADRGIRFSHAFAAEPVCKDNRVSLLSGQYARVHGVGFSLKHALSHEQWAQTYPALLRDAGYWTGFVGKFGVESYAFRGNAKTKFDYWRAHDGWAKFWIKQETKLYPDAKAQIITPIMSECIDDFLASRDKAKPFCLSVSFSAPHGSISSTMHGPKAMTEPANKHPQLANHPVYGGLYRDAAIQLPDTWTQDTGRYLPLEVHDPSKGRTRTYPYNFTRESCIEHHHRYYQLVHGIDRAVGRLMSALQEQGVADNTVILFTSDHGLLMGDYGIGGKALCYDLATRVPLIVYDPRLPEKARGRVLDQLALSIDIAPTILELAGIEPRGTMQGRSLMPLVQNKDESWRDEVFLENLYIGRDGLLIEAVRTDRWKYVRYFEPDARRLRPPLAGLPEFNRLTPDYEQLFDLKQDPGETKNLASLEAHRPRLEQLRERCRALSEQASSGE